MGLFSEQSLPYQRASIPHARHPFTPRFSSLLAWEQHEKLLEAGIPTELITGQETISCFHPTHLSATVEMADITARWDVAVIDECQNIGHPERGWAWTR
jgi:hypothetical protein